MYYYNIKKNENFQYLIMRYIDFEGDRLIVDHNSMSLGGFVFMIIGIVVGSIVVLAIIIVSIILIKRAISENRYQRYIEAKQKEKETEKEKEKLNSDIYYEPTSQ